MIKCTIIFLIELFIDIFPFFTDEFCTSLLNFHSITEGHKSEVSEMTVNQTGHILQPNTTLKTLKFTCDVCQKRFSFKCNLKAHMLIHSGARPFECNICKKAFAYKHVLKRHMIVHQVNMNVQ